MSRKALPNALLSVRPEEGARRVALSFVREAQEACVRLKDGTHSADDTEALHDLRVALRRLRSAMRAYAQVLNEAVPKKRRKNLRSLVQSTNEARDAEVQLSWIEENHEALSEVERLGADAWRHALERTKHHAYRQIIEDKVPRLRTLLVQLARDLSEYDVHCVVFASEGEATFGEVASDTLALLLRDLEKALARVRSHEDESEAHEARIVGKRLRYVLEPLREASPEASDALRELKKLQDVLGSLQDLAVRTHALSKAVEDAALARARTEVGLVVNDETRAPGHVNTEPGLLALLRLAQTQKRQVLDEVIGDWATGPNLAGLSDSLSKAVRALGGEEDDAPREIERKYLLNAMPPFVRDHAFSRLEQGYVPGSSIVERVRRKVDAKGNKKHFRTVKLGRGIERIEIEEEITAELFASLFALTKGRRVRKKRYAITEGEHTWEIDVFTDRELVLAEVELTSADIQPALPEWLEPFVVREVTDEDTYVNLNLAQ